MPMVVVNQGGKIVLVNTQTEGLFGLGTSEGRSFGSVVPGENGSIAETLLGASCQGPTERSRRLPHRINQKGGSIPANTLILS